MDEGSRTYTQEEAGGRETNDEGIDYNAPTNEEEADDMLTLKMVVTEAAAQGAKLLVAWIWARLGRKKE